MVNRGDAIGWDEWRKLPIEKQMGWRIPIDLMIDLPHLQKTYNVLRMRDYLQLHNLPADKEWSNGAWHRQDYQAGTPKTTLHVIPNEDYDPKNVVRVDSMAAFAHVDREAEKMSEESKRLFGTLGDELVMDFDKAKLSLEGSIWTKWGSEEAFEKHLADNGWATVHTWAGA
jgi:hypothetical protein